MPSFICRRLLSIKTLCLMLLIFTTAGCGGVDWFPEYVRQPTTPDPFSFAEKRDVTPGSVVTSDPITVSGLTAESSPISITGSVGSNSLYAIDGGTATAAAGTVKNGQTVTVTHTASPLPGIATFSDLMIGNVTARFTSTTQTVVPPVFAPATAVPGGALIESNAAPVNTVSGTHTISISDDLQSPNAAYALGTESFTQFQGAVFIANGELIKVRNRSSPTPGASVVTTLTIDGVSSTFTLTTAP